MDDSPLLSDHDEFKASRSAADFLLQCKRLGCLYLRLACHKICFWWEVTSDPDFLASWASRRSQWKFMLCFIYLFQSLGIRLFENTDMHVFSKIGFCVVTFIMPTHQIWNDAVIVTVLFLTVLQDALSDPVPEIGVGFASSWIMLMLAFLGFHSYSIYLFFTALSITLLSVNPQSTLINFVGAAPILYQVLVAEFRTAYVFRELQEKQQSVEMLLDKATNGFCSVEASTGVIQSASPQLAKTLANNGNLVGRRLYEFIQKSDHPSITAILEFPSAVRTMNSTLVSCIQQASASEPRVQVTFDAKIIPFMTSNRVIQLCLQVQGEMRMHRESNTSVNESQVSTEKRSDSRDSAHDAENRSLSRGSGPLEEPVKKSASELSFNLERKKSTSELSLNFSMTESVWSSDSTRRSRKRLQKYPSFPSTPVMFRDFGVQTDELHSPSSGGGVDLGAVQHGSPVQPLGSTYNTMFQSSHGADLPRPPKLPVSATTPFSDVTRGRSPVRRLPPMQSKKTVMPPVHPLPGVVCPVKNEKTEASQEQAEEAQSADSAPAAQQGLPAFPVISKEKKTTGRRTRLGHNVSKLQ